MTQNKKDLSDEQRKEMFLTFLVSNPNVVRACKAACIARKTVYRWRDADPEFAAAWKAAEDKGTDALEHEAIRRACDGTLKPIFHGGKKVGTVREYSDTLLIFLLKGRRPEKFKERYEHGGPGGGPIPLQVIRDESDAGTEAAES